MATTKRRKKRAVKAKRTVKRKTRRKPRRVVAARRKAVKRKPAKKRRKAGGRRVVKQVERRSVERVLTGKKKTRRRRRRVVMAGSSPRRRRVGSNGNGGGGMKWLVPVAIGAAALYFLTKKNSPASPGGVYQLPPLTNTQNQIRNTQSQDLVNYAVAGGLALDAIMKLIDKLNSSNDQEVQNIYDVYHTTGALDGLYV
jgi:hypothetical protein